VVALPYPLLPTAGNARRLARRRQMLIASLSLPALLLLGIFFMFPVARLMALSVADGTLQWYAKALGERLYLEVFLLTFEIAAAVTAAALLLGYPLAYFLATTTRFWRAVGFIMVILPLWTSILVRTYAWMVLLGRNGPINKMLMGLGIISEPLPLLHNFTGVLIGMVHVLLPYMVLPIYGAVRRLDPSLIQAAEGMGASPLRILWKIQLPLTASGIVAGSILVFVLSLGFFITPALLGGGRVIMISILIQQQVSELLNWKFAGALSVVLLGMTIALYGLVQWLAGRRLETAR
jgi:ABC-type spermidine/putrescine transport system permease subunit I